MEESGDGWREGAGSTSVTGVPTRAALRDGGRGSEPGLSGSSFSAMALCPALPSLTDLVPLPSSDERLTAEEMDEQRRQNVAYQYLCRLEEAKR